jgi:N-acetylglucosamine-6-phosphate deacetylase
MITVAPELEGALPFIKELASDILVSLGHSAATYEQALQAIEAGARNVTHLFNAMPAMHHREPGLIGAAFEKGIYAEIIADGIHVHPTMVKAAFKLFGPERLTLVSDAISATGLSDGSYQLGDLPIVVQKGVARTSQGALAGSTVSLWDCVKNMVAWGISLEDAIRMASLTPATKIDCTQKGSIALGKDADFFVIDDTGEICATFVEGTLAYSKQGFVL